MFYSNISFKKWPQLSVYKAGANAKNRKIDKLGIQKFRTNIVSLAQRVIPSPIKNS